MAVDSVITSSSTGYDGNAYTTSVSNDTLTNEDFLTLMLEEMKQQDPTSPMDSAALMDSQMQMSTIQANQDMTTALNSLQASYANSALATAANLVGTSIKTGATDGNGDDKVYKVVTVDNKEGELYVSAKQFTGVIDGLQITKADDTTQMTKYDSSGFIYDLDGEVTQYKVSLDSDGRFEYNEDDSIKLLDNANGDAVVTDAAIKKLYTYGGYALQYSNDTIEIPLSSITAVS